MSSLPVTSIRRRLKIEFELPLNYDDNEHENVWLEQCATDQSNIFKEDFLQSWYHIVDVTSEPIVNGDFSRLYVINYEVEGDIDDDATNIFKAIRAFFKRIRSPTFCLVRKTVEGTNRLTAVDLNVRPTIQLHALEWFSNKICSANLGNNLHRIHFGAFHSGVMFSHWEVGYELHDPLQNRRFVANFEFDRNVINVEFDNFERRMKPDSSPPRFEDCYPTYRLQVNHKTIRRVIVDLLDNARPRIHFDLHSPVVVKKAMLGKDDPKPPKRTLNIRRSTKSVDWSSIAALSESPVFTLELRSMADDFLYPLLSRLRRRINVPIEFASMEIVSVPYSNRVNPYYQWTPRNPEQSNEDGSLSGSPTREGFQGRPGRGSAPSPQKKIWEDICERISPTSLRDPTFRSFIDKTFISAVNTDKENDLAKDNAEAIHYLIEALISRGSIVKNQLLLDFHHWTLFLNAVAECYRKAAQQTIEGLARIVNAIDENKRSGCIRTALRAKVDELLDSGESFGLTQEQEEQGYLRVRKVIVTPTRVILVPPENVMGNRVLRNERNTEILRLSFRDDDHDHLRIVKASSHLVEMTVGKVFRRGVTLAGKEYRFLGCSSSQLRENGCYMMVLVRTQDRADYDREMRLAIEGEAKRDAAARNGQTYRGVVPPRPPKNFSIRRLRKDLGKFLALQNIPKIMARLGQCFTQSKECETGLERGEYTYFPDIIGGNDLNGDPYCFSDGVAIMSLAKSEIIGREMGHDRPSCCQIRFRGAKGVQSVDPLLDDIARWAETYNIPPPHNGNKKYYGPPSWKLHCVFRDSQTKFQAPYYENTPIELVKFSSPTNVCLNKPFLMILDQVSEKQSRVIHDRLVYRVHVLLDRQVRNYARMLLSEVAARNKLKELPSRIDIDRLSQRAGFELSQEPFFRSLVKATVIFGITKQLRKLQIHIPSSSGRSMLGILDETGRLQSGQIFVQYTCNMGSESLSRKAAKHVVKGRIMVTKNPTNVQGDVRIFEGVDIPELRHLYDVIVFPQHGPRPHPDEMAGSDLDGDEYSVIWDPELMIDHNEKPADYQAVKKPANAEEITEDNLDELTCEFYTKYVKNDSVGSISNALLFQSDLYGIDSPVCATLALKVNQAVDFSKSGIAPDPLVRSWSRVVEEDEDSDWLPPEKPERFPDYHFNNDYSPIYVSDRLVGKLYREVKKIEDLLQLSLESRTEDEPVNLDALLKVEGYSAYAEIADKRFTAYIGKMKSLMEMFGVSSEAELFSGYICDTRNRISEKESDDFSYWNSRRAIEAGVTAIFKKEREDFFEEFGGWEQMTTFDHERNEHNVLKRPISIITESVKQKASAFYMTCYQRANRTSSGPRFLSFPWIVADVLAEIRQPLVARGLDFGMFSTPIVKETHRHCDTYIEQYKNRFTDFNDTVITPNSSINRYSTRFRGLNRLLFIVCEWAARRVHHQRLPRLHIALLVIQFATGSTANPLGMQTPESKTVFLDTILDDVSMEELERTSSEFSGELQVELLLAFLEYISSHKFKTLESISFPYFGISSLYRRGEWMPLHDAAVASYFGIVFNMVFDLPLKDENDKPAEIIREMDPFIIEIPETVRLDVVKDVIIEKTGVADLCLRPIPHRKEHVSVVCQGTLASCYKLRSLVAGRPNITETDRGKNLSGQLANVTYNSIMAPPSGRINAHAILPLGLIPNSHL